MTSGETLKCDCRSKQRINSTERLCCQSDAALDAVTEPIAAQRQAAWDDLQAIIAEANDNVRQAGESPESIDQAIDEACDEVRYGK